MKVFRHLAKFKEFNSFEGWVRRITVNTAITHYRRNLKHRYHDDVTETLSTPLDLAASKQADFTMSEIQTAMAALPKGYRTGAAVPRRRLLPQGDCGNVGRGCEHVEKPIVSGAEATSGFPRGHVTARQSHERFADAEKTDPQSNHLCDPTFFQRLPTKFRLLTRP